MFTLNQSFLQHSLSAVRQHVLLPLTELTAKQKIVAVIAAVIFSCMAACALLYYTCFKRNENVKVPEKPIQEDQTAAKTAHAVLPQLKLVIPETPPVSSPKVEQLTPAEKKEEKVDTDFESSESPDDIEEDDFDSEDQISVGEDEITSDGESSDEEDVTPKKSDAPKQKYFIEGKEYSLRSFKCIEKLKAELKSLGKITGSAIDNGDCFWESFAQGLSRLLGREVTIKELREIVSKEVKRLNQGPENENWVKRMIDKEVRPAESYEEYLVRVALDCHEALEMGFTPVWGQEARDGVILCRHFQVKLEAHSSGCYDDHPSKMEDKDNFFIGSQNYPYGEKYSRKIEIAIYPGHFVPVWDIQGSHA